MSRFKDEIKKPLAPQTNPPQGPPAEAAERPVAINGFQQVIEMLRIADPAFRDSLLRRLAMRDKALAESIRRDLMGE